MKYSGMRVAVQLEMENLVPERMSPGLALFNGHINDAANRAAAVLREFFPDFLNEVRALEEKGNGIMYLTQIDPTPATAAYLALVTAFVNGAEPKTEAQVIAESLERHQRELMLRFEPGTLVSHPAYGLVDLGLFEKCGYEPRFGGFDTYVMTDLGTQVYDILKGGA